jgi:CheY-like chemotaxis protein
MPFESRGYSERNYSFYRRRGNTEFFFQTGLGYHRQPGASYLLLLDIRMPKIDGIEVLRRLKEDEELKKIPVIMITTTDDPREIDFCHRLGCNSYIAKPLDYDHFVNAIQQLGFFLKIVHIPSLEGSANG